MLAHSDLPDFESQGRGIPNYLGASRHLTGRHAGVGAFEAGQHRARHAARRPQHQLPEHGARDQLAHRSRSGDRGSGRAHRPRQLQRRERRRVRSAAASTCSSRSRPAAKSRWSTRTAAGRSSASTSAARRRAWRCRRTARSCSSTTSWIARVGVFDLRPLLQDRRRPNVPLARDAERGHDRETHGDRAEGQAVLLRRTRSRGWRATAT